MKRILTPTPKHLWHRHLAGDIPVLRCALMFLIVLACASLFATTARAESYWIAYEGNDFPENEGWTRITNGPLAERWIEDGTLVVDTTEDRHTCDWYNLYPSITAPAVDEEFILQWRLKIEEFTGGGPGPTVGVYSDERWGVSFITGSVKHWTLSPCGVADGGSLEVTLDNARLALRACVGRNANRRSSRPGSRDAGGRAHCS